MGNLEVVEWKYGFSEGLELPFHRIEPPILGSFSPALEAFPWISIFLKFWTCQKLFYFLSFFRSHHFVVNVLSLALLSILTDAGYLLSLLIIFLMLIVRNMGFPILFLYASVPLNRCLWKCSRVVCLPFLLFIPSWLPALSYVMPLRWLVFSCFYLFHTHHQTK